MIKDDYLFSVYGIN